MMEAAVSPIHLQLIHPDSPLPQDRPLSPLPPQGEYSKTILQSEVPKKIFGSKSNAFNW